MSAAGTCAWRRARIAALTGWLCLLALAPAGSLHAQDGEARYREAAAAFHGLRTAGAATPEQWRALAERFRAIQSPMPDSRRGADALYSAALANREAWRVSGEWQDLSRAVATFRDFAGHYAGDRLADDALMHMATLLAEGYQDLPAARDAYRRVVERYSDGDQHPAARLRLTEVESAIAAASARERATADAAAAQRAQTSAAAAAAAAGNGSPPTTRGEQRPELSALAAAAVAAPDDGAPTRDGRVRRVQVWSAMDWTRVIITTDPGVAYTVNRLAGDASRPERVYLDLQRSQPGGELAAVTNVGDLVLNQIRTSRYDEGTTRVVLDLKLLERYEVKDFRLPGERKIVVDLHPTAAAVAAARRQAVPGHTAVTAVTAPARLPQPLAALNGPLPEPLVQVPVGLQVRSIMIDPGHGGHDPGALGYGTAEKDLVLAISRRLRDLLRARHPTLRIGLTREADAFIPLQERPQIAKRFGADLFVSVHLNANPITRFHGVETYFLNLTQDREALQVAARENATSEQHVNDLNGILLDLLRDSNLIESGELAKAVQTSLVGTLRGEHSAVRDLGVKQAPFLVLMGAEMPSVLVEAGFITNRSENQRLQDSDYLNRIAEGIYDGLRRYIEQQNIIGTGHPAGPLAANDRP